MANRELLEQLDALQFQLYPIPVSPEFLIVPACPQQNAGKWCMRQLEMWSIWRRLLHGSLLHLYLFYSCVSTDMIVCSAGNPETGAVRLCSETLSHFPGTTKENRKSLNHLSDDYLDVLGVAVRVCCRHYSRNVVLLNVYVLRLSVVPT